MSKTAQTLNKLFETNRIVSWRDEKNELRDEFLALELDGVEKIEISNNEFQIKYRILRKEPEKKFLLFSSGPIPPDEENWLLDVELAYGVFRADQASLILNELGLGFEYLCLVHEHGEFFKAARRIEALKKLLEPHDSSNRIRLKMLAITTGTEKHFDSVLEKLLEELAQGESEKIATIKRYNLDVFLWQNVKRMYNYLSESPSVKDFILRLFRACYFATLDPETSTEVRLNDEAFVFLKRFKDSRQYGAAFEECSSIASRTFDIDADLQKRDITVLGDLDYFKNIDQHIVQELVRQIIQRTLPVADCSNIIRQRKQTFWYERLKHIYSAIDYASQFLNLLDRTNLKVDSIFDGFNCYTKQYFKLDQLYRKFIYHSNESRQPDLLTQLADLVDNLYTNNYLLRLNDLWQEKLDRSGQWEIPTIERQSVFFDKNVAPVLENGKKVYVIISDALRYEIAEEICERIRVEDRYDAELGSAYALLPSYTALGMAALLPHKALTLQADDIVAVLADGMSTLGSANRAKVLAAGCRSTVIPPEALLALNKENGRALIRDNDVVYVYHNVIDAAGDDKTTENKTFEAVEQAIIELIALAKKLANLNANNIIITSDHGFIYQNRELPESDFIACEPSGEKIFQRNRRFVIGQNLSEVSGLKKYTLPDLGLQGNCEIQISKSINRLRVKGSGSRYVHGGATLQEITIPVLKVRKKREGSTSCVDVDIISSAQVITSGQIAVMFYQQQPVEGKILPRKVKVGLYSMNGKLISDEHELVFDLPGADSRDRQISCRIVLTHESDEFNGQEVELKMMELEPDTTLYKVYNSRKYQLRRQLMEIDF